MKRILLVYPVIPDTYWSFSHSISLAGFKSLMPPLGLLTVASLIPEEYEVTLIDMNVESLTDRRLKNADMVMVSAMLVQKESFHDVAKRCRGFGIPVAAGGPYPSACQDEMDDVDYLILGEGEGTIPLFFDELAAGRACRVYKSDTRPDIALSPPPRYDLLKISNYSTMALQASRGCPFNCEFCDIVSLYGRKPRYKTPEQFVTELEILYYCGFRGPVFIVDDNFIGNRLRVMELLQEVHEWQKAHRYPFTFFTEASINLAADDELLELMTAARFTMVFIGIESPSRESLLESSKNQNAFLDMTEAVRRIQNCGIEVLGGFIVGFDSDTPDIFKMQADFIRETAIPVAMVGLLQAFPGTRLWQRLSEEGRLRKTSSGNNTQDDINFEPLMDENILRRGYRNLISSLYRPAAYYDRCRRLISRLPHEAGGGSRVRWWEIRAFFNALLRFAISPYRREFYSFLMWVILHHPRQFSRATGIAIKGYHFFRLTDRMIVTSEFNSLLDDMRKYLRKTLQLWQETQTTPRDIGAFTRSVRRQARLVFLALPPPMRAAVRLQYRLFMREVRTITAGSDH